MSDINILWYITGFNVLNKIKSLLYSFYVYLQNQAVDGPTQKQNKTKGGKVKKKKDHYNTKHHSLDLYGTAFRTSQHSYESSAHASTVIQNQLFQNATRVRW